MQGRPRGGPAPVEIVPSRPAKQSVPPPKPRDDGLRINTITAGADAGERLDLSACFESGCVAPVQALAFYCAHRRSYVVKGNVPKNVSSFTTKNMPLIAYIGENSRIKVCVYATGKIHLVGATSFDAMAFAMETVCRRVVGLKRVPRVDVYMVNAGFKIPRLIDRVACVAAWNRDSSQHGFASVHVERHAAARIKLANGVTIMVYRTGSVQVTGNEWRAVHEARDVFLEFLRTHPCVTTTRDASP